MNYRQYTKIAVPNRKGTVRIVEGSKPPKQKHKIGDKFENPDGTWLLVYAFRLANEKGVWYYCLEDITNDNCFDWKFRNDLETVCCVEPITRIMYAEFMTLNESQYFFSGIPELGERLIVPAKDLAKFRKLETGGPT